MAQTQNNDNLKIVDCPVVLVKKGRTKKHNRQFTSSVCAVLHAYEKFCQSDKAGATAIVQLHCNNVQLHCNH